MAELRSDDTIAALASAPGPAPRGIVRISGAASRQVLDGLFDPDDGPRWRRARVAGCHAGRLRWSASVQPLPVSVYLWPHRRSYTGEPMAELHTVGSPPLLEALLAELYAHDVRPARPGEFTLRAFLAGRVDLVQAEAVLGVVDAHDQRELETALRQLAGGLSGKMAEIRGNLLDLLADLEAGLDFVDEDIEFVTRDEVASRLGAAQSELEALLDQAAARMHSAAQMRVVLAGLPNAGKSTLFNALAGSEAALVSEFEGTTRDYLSARLDWNGLPIELIDTAGWESEANSPDSGVRRDAGIMSVAQSLRSEQLVQCDLILWCTAADLDAPSRAADATLVERLRRDNCPLLAVSTKCDLAADESTGYQVRVSARTGAGLPELIAVATEHLTAHAGGRQFVGATAARCRESLGGAVAALQRGCESLRAGAGDEIVAIDVRDSLEHLGSILGTVYTDDILDRIFSKFCIGK